MEQLVKFLSGQLPAFWAAILAYPLLDLYFPDLLGLIQIDNIHVVIAFIIWLVVYEIVMINVLMPFLYIFIALLVASLPIYSIWLKLMPYEKLKKMVEEDENNEKLSERKRLAVTLVQDQLKDRSDVSDSYALELAKSIGSEELAKKSGSNDRGAEFAVSVSIASLSFGALYLCFPPDLSALRIDSFYVAVALITSSLLVGAAGIFLYIQEGYEKFDLAVITLSGLGRDKD